MIASYPGQHLATYQITNGLLNSVIITYIISSS